MNIFSEFRVIKFNGSSTLHHVLESSNFFHVGTASSTKVAGLGRFLNRVDLLANGWSHVIGLIFICTLSGLTWSPCLRKSPSWEIKLVWRVWRSLRNVAAGSNSSRSWSLVLETTSSAIPESILGRLHNLWFIVRKVLRSRSLFKIISLHLSKISYYWVLLLARFLSWVQSTWFFYWGQLELGHPGTYCFHRNHTLVYLYHPFFHQYQIPILAAK